MKNTTGPFPVGRVVRTLSFDSYVGEFVPWSFDSIGSCQLNCSYFLIFCFRVFTKERHHSQLPKGAKEDFETKNNWPISSGPRSKDVILPLIYEGICNMRF